MSRRSILGDTESELRGRLVGTWKLVSTEEKSKDGATRPFPQFGPNGKGFLMYQADGHMCAFIQNPNRSKSGDLVRAALDEKVAADDGTFAYCGRYEIDVERKQIVHLPELATAHGYVGSRQVRPYQFEGKRLIFSDIEKQEADVDSPELSLPKPKSGFVSRPVNACTGIAVTLGSTGVHGRNWDGMKKSLNSAHLLGAGE